MTDGTGFALLMEQRRGELGLSREELAGRLNLPEEVVEEWENGVSIPGASDVTTVATAVSLPASLLREAVRQSGPLPETAPPAPYQPELTADPADPPADDQPAPAARSRSARTRISSLLDRAGAAFARRRRLAKAPAASPSYLEDPDQVVTYRVRMVFTTAGILVLILLFRWALGGLTSAVADLWNAFRSVLG